MYTSSHRSPVPYISAALLAVTTAAVAAYYHRSVWSQWWNNNTKTILKVVVDHLDVHVASWKRRLQHEGGSGSTPTEDAGSGTAGIVSVKPIGVVRSVYRLCVGTPRQGLLSPQSRGRIELTVENASDMVDGLEGFSHIWILFVFHLNTVPKNHKSPPTKIAPPALGGQKVGVLATRSPHRYNPMGMTLCKLDSISIVGGGSNNNNKKTKKSSSSQKKSNGAVVVLNISGLDLVDGTPVLDIKPYVPHYDSVHGSSPEPRLPSWVSEGLDTKREVRISDPARSQLLAILKEDPFVLDFYGPHRGDEYIMNTMKSVLLCIEQVLSIDVRSSWQTTKAREGKSQAERADRIQHAMMATPAKTATTTTTMTPMSSFHSADSTEPMCSQQLDNLLIHYTVDHQPDNIHREASKGSGAEDVVTVQSIQLLLQPNMTNRDEQHPSSTRQAPMLSPSVKGDSASIHSNSSNRSSPPRVIFPTKTPATPY